MTRPAPRSITRSTSWRPPSVRDGSKGEGDDSSFLPVLHRLARALDADLVVQVTPRTDVA